MSTVKWHSRLSTEGWSLVDGEGFYVCHEIGDKRYFAKFPNFILFAVWVYKDVSLSHNTFHEIISGNIPQKPYFDIDINNTVCDFKSKGHKLCSEIVAGIMAEFNEIKATDIMLLSSTSDEKFSAHIIVDNWCVFGSEENREFCSLIMKHVSEDLREFIDIGMYKRTQFLRVYKSHKWGSTRIKELDDNSNWCPEVMPTSNGQAYVSVLRSSLVTVTSHCSFLPIICEKERRTFSSEDIDDDTVDRCVQMCDPSGCFSVINVEGGLIMLKREAPSYCNVCKREHESENPYIIVVNGNVYFNCRRTRENQYLGKLFPNKDVLEYVTQKTSVQAALQPQAPLQREDSVDSVANASSQHALDKLNHRPLSKRKILTQCIGYTPLF